MNLIIKIKKNKIKIKFMNSLIEEFCPLDSYSYRLLHIGEVFLNKEDSLVLDFTIFKVMN